MKWAMIAALVHGLLGCGAQPPLTSSSGGGEGGGSNGSGGEGGGSSTSGTCLCEPVPACADPNNFTLWCEGHGPGPFGATACAGCAPSACLQQPGPLPACFAAELWCCVHDFNPAPEPQTFHCYGGVACEVENGTFTTLCSYDEDVSALDATAALQLLLEECQKEFPQYPCGVLDLVCL